MIAVILALNRNEFSNMGHINDMGKAITQTKKPN